MKLLIISLLFIPLTAWAQRVTFINPGKSDEVYWVTATKAMQMAASSLNMQLEVIYTEREHLKSIDIAKQIISRPGKDRPEYVIFSNDYGVAPYLLKLFNEEKIPCLMAFSSPSSKERSQTGAPRENFKYWLGSIEPDADYGGYITAIDLIRKGRQKNLRAPDGKIHLLAIAGDRSTNSSILRNEGMLRAVNQSRDVILDQLVYADWQRELASEKVEWLLKRHPSAKLIWSGNDQMSFGAMEALEKNGGTPGKTVLFSAINTSPEAFSALQSERLSTLAGGHFIAGAWAMVMIHDYARGIDFTNEGLSLVKPMFTLFSKNDTKVFLKYVDDYPAPIDFKGFSKYYNPALKKYHFELNGQKK
jgi:DNA-binding LacI/PurR family transcriptional regulator